MSIDQPLFRPLYINYNMAGNSFVAKAILKLSHVAKYIYDSL